MMKQINGFSHSFLSTQIIINQTRESIVGRGDSFLTFPKKKLI